MSRKQMARSSSPSGQIVTLNRYTDRVNRRYVVFVDRHPVFESRVRDAARKRFDDVVAGIETPPPVVRLDDWDDAARAVQNNPTVEIDILSFPLLAAVHRAIMTQQGRTPAHVRTSELIARIVGSQPIPSKPDALERWLSDAVGNLLSGVRSKTTHRTRCFFFLTAFRVCVRNFPLAFRRITPLLPQVEAAARRSGISLGLPLRDVRNYAPMSRAEVEVLTKGASNFDERILLWLYFAGGFRRGEAERVRSEFIRDGELEVAEVQTKTKGRRGSAHTCRASTALQLCVALLGGKVDAALPRTLLVKRCRPTAATWWSLCGVSTLEVAARLGHTSRKMSDEHYVRTEFVRGVLDGAKSPEEALFVYDGEVVEFEYPGAPAENAWDRWVLLQVLLTAKDHGKVDVAKEHLGRILGTEVEAPKVRRVVSF